MKRTYMKTVKQPDRQPFPLSKQAVKAMYYEEHVSMCEIGKKAKRSRQCVARWMTYWGFQRRTSLEGLRLARKDAAHGPNWKGGEWFQPSSGYWVVYAPSHPYASTRNTIRRCRAVAEERIGRLCTEQEVVHHLDFDKANDEPENLCVLSKRLHALLHMALGRVGAAKLLRRKCPNLPSITAKLVKLVYTDRVAEVTINERR
ncbi:hypothetical protein LCGC14_0898020 [marine sediment metagenome]|uniref:HNH nuclease domain-containing protein n=1 Tax=marine sediment metagenome TaxID=412755 RepID=A0A0F9S429_9ZZZZ